MKKPFMIESAMQRLRAAVADVPKAAMFELFEHGHTTLFEQLVACLISIRTYDEVSLPTALKLLARARTPEDMRRLSVEEIDGLIRASSFHENKARQIRQIAERAADEYG